MSQERTGHDSQEKITFQVISPEKVLINEKDVDIVVFRYKYAPDKDEGEVGIMRNHAPMLVRLPQVAPVRYVKGDQTYFLAVAGGFVEVRNNRVTVLSTGAERVSDKQELDAAIKAKRRAAAWLEEGERIGKVEFDEKLAEAEVKKEVIRIYKEQAGDQK
ncbi:MAG: hypothetical protein K6U11_06545 [bacterium]|nr:hypothetical protein [bacterium]